MKYSALWDLTFENRTLFDAYQTLILFVIFLLFLAAG